MDRNNQNPQDRRRRPSRKPSKVSRRLLTIAAVVGVSIFLAVFALQSFSDLFGLNQKDQQIEITVESGMSSRQIINLLKDEGVISQKLTFQLYAGLRNSTSKFKPGVYLLNSNMSYDEIIVALQTGNEKQNTVRITFPEGMTLREIANLLEEKGVCKAQDLYNYLETANLEEKYDFVEKIPKEEHRFRRFEGYFFPDTYDFFLGESPERVTARFLDNFESKITDEMYAQMKNQNLTLDETSTLASMIQEESSGHEEMGRVSSVFHNRLDNSVTYPRLQSDVTIFYVNRDIKPFLQVNDQEMYDAYNTYKCTGLPVGPVCNPGIDAIKAALYPEDTDYYFFLTDANGKFYYAKTADQHYQNEQIAAQTGEVHGTDTQD